jgi:hypothetical protein
LVTSSVLRWPGKAALVGAALAARTIWVRSQKPVPVPLEHSDVVLDQPAPDADKIEL